MQQRLRAALDRAFLVIGCLCHWVVARLPLTRDPDLWVFGTRSGQGFADNAKYLYLHVAANHPEIRAVWLSTDPEVVETLRARGYEAHHTRSLRGLRANLRAGVVCVTHGLRDVTLALSGGARAVLLWHGTPLKHISWDSHFPGEPLPVRLAHSYAHDVLDRITIPAEAMIPAFVSGLHIDPEVLAVTGYPRNDALVGSIADDDIGLDGASLRAVEALAAEHRLVLSLPTFRDSGESVFETLDTAALDELLERHDAYLLVKPHPNEPLEPGTLAGDRIRGLPERVDSHALLPLADALLTDYSSVFFDYLLLDRPVLFYAPDLDRYRAERGFYFDYDEVTPGPVARTNPELLAALDRTLGAEADGFAAERARVRERFCDTRPDRAERVFRTVRGHENKRVRRSP
ncbi:CDP-glycerol glycerophosphotransferase family protein [Halococcus hamelinensis]|uniref:Glycosyl/glycerophosphate transferase n=1 Tax=Halococcus hamelinensis 100A6 TaxID=1132509 RepID=M0M1P7_9EURY|nr:CDP-glycerol glycerophosphotransferase family protein [Halococcus hamelinensis]EMA39757.1 glycosyl/glycerophosphate transferase [Halococcus hamelinensis 100A6]